MWYLFVNLINVALFILSQVYFNWADTALMYQALGSQKLETGEWSK